jgi:acetone carboxylase gamma subunit
VTPLQESLYLVLKGKKVIVKCFCGYEFGDYKENWKLNAVVYPRNPEDNEIFPKPLGADSNWVTMREFYCPGCGVQLEVEVVPHGHPIVFNAELNIEDFYARMPNLAKRVFRDLEIFEHKDKRNPIKPVERK